MTNNPTEQQAENTVTIIEDWNEREGCIYYRWKITGAEDWNEKLTPYKEKPVIQFKTLSHREFEEFYDNRLKEVHS